MDTAAFLQGLMLVLALIASLGPQNLHVLETGLRGRHVGTTVAVCIGADALLIGLALAGVADVLQLAKPHAELLRWALAAWCALWAVQAMRNWSRGPAMFAVPVAPGGVSRWRSLLVTGAVTFANPAVYVETLLIVGGAAASLDLPSRISFGSGALAASALWFCSLGFGARCVAPWLARAAVIGVLQFSGALVMAWMAVRMVTAPAGP